MRISLGYDRHVLVSASDGVVVLSGAKFYCGFSVVAHSDGDAVFHAVADAISSVFLNKTIGELFPDTDDEWSGCDSSFFLKEIYSKSGSPSVESLDVVVISDQVMLRERIGEMRANLAGILNIDCDKVSMKGRRKEDGGASPAIECFCSILFS